MWYLNPKNILLVVLAVAVLSLGITFAFQKAHIANLKTEKAMIEADYNIQSATIAGLQNNLRDIQKLQGRLQVINDNTARIRAIVIRPGGTNEDYIKDANLISDYFNNGMLDKAGGNSIGSKILSFTGKTDTDASK